MPQIGKKYRLVNPGGKRKRRKLSLKQIKFFGTKRQRAALKNGPYSFRKTKKRSAKLYGTKMKSSKRAKYLVRSGKSIVSRRRRPNVGSILTVLPINPGRIRKRRRTSSKGKTQRRRNKGMATRKQLRALAKARAARRRMNGTHRRRRNPSRRRRSTAVIHHRRRRRSNPVMHYRRRRRSNPGRRYHRRRNPGFLSGTGGRVIGVIGGAAVTSIATNMLPASFTTGVMGYIAASVVSVLQGKVFGKVFKSPALGNDMMVGGFTYVALKVLADYFPSLAAYSPFSLSGLGRMGLIGPSNFYVPQVNMPGSMGTFVRPSSIPAPVMVSSSGNAVPGMHGMGSMRRVGRMR